MFTLILFHRSVFETWQTTKLTPNMTFCNVLLLKLRQPVCWICVLLIVFPGVISSAIPAATTSPLLLLRQLLILLWKTNKVICSSRGRFIRRLQDGSSASWKRSRRVISEHLATSGGPSSAAVRRQHASCLYTRMLWYLNMIRLGGIIMQQAGYFNHSTPEISRFRCYAHVSRRFD